MWEPAAGVINAGNACAEGTPDAKLIMAVAAARPAIRDEVKWRLEESAGEH